MLARRLVLLSARAGKVCEGGNPVETEIYRHAGRGCNEILGLEAFFSQYEICISKPYHPPQIEVAMEKNQDNSSIYKPRCDFRKEELHSWDMDNERRRVPRYSAHVKATIKLPGENATFAAMVEDLCVLGCLLEYGPTMEIHQECDFAMSWKGREFRTPAVVAWKGERGQVGLEFHHTAPANQQMLREFCADFHMKSLLRLPDSPD